jgi:hypothetical protein
MGDPYAILKKAESIDFFTTTCQIDQVNSLARKNCSYTPWPEQTLASKATEYIPYDLRESVKVVILNPSAEGGMPHTRPGVICLPAYFPDSMLEETMKHELVHVDQRINREHWKLKLVKEGWVEESESSIPEHWLERCRMNPDTWSSRFWSWEDRYIALPVFQRTDVPSMKEFDIFWYDKQEERAIRKAPLDFVEQYGTVSPSAQEHPYELMAYT